MRGFAIQLLFHILVVQRDDDYVFFCVLIFCAHRDFGYLNEFECRFLLNDLVWSFIIIKSNDYYIITTVQTHDMPDNFCRRRREGKLCFKFVILSDLESPQAEPVDFIPTPSVSTTVDTLTPVPVLNIPRASERLSSTHRLFGVNYSAD